MQESNTETCKYWCGVKCVNGGCPIATEEETNDYCEDCYEREYGCKKCIFAGSPICKNKDTHTEEEKE